MSSYSILEKENKRKAFRKSLLENVFLLIVILFLCLYGIYIFYIAPFKALQNKKTQTLQMIQQLHPGSQIYNTDITKNVFYTKIGNEYYVYDEEANLIEKKLQFDEAKLKQFIAKSQIKVNSIKVGYGYHDIAIVLENDQFVYLIDYDEFKVIFKGEK